MSSSPREGGATPDDPRAAHRRTLTADAVRRRQVARTLHDGVQQHLVLTLLTLQLAREASPPERSTDLLAEAGGHLQRAIDELRDVVNAIHPTILDSLGLLAAVESLVERAHLPATVTGSVTHYVDPTIQSSAYLLVAETLNNAVAQVPPSHVQVRINGDDRQLVVELSDYGDVQHGAVGPAVPRTLADVMSALDGTFTVQSEEGLGTTVRAVYPLPRPADPRPTFWS